VEAYVDIAAMITTMVEMMIRLFEISLSGRNLEVDSNPGHHPSMALNVDRGFMADSTPVVTSRR
jgi:hypothetical protein